LLSATPTINHLLSWAVVGFDYQCTACLWGAELLFRYHKMGWNPDRAISSLSSLCSIFKIQSKVGGRSYDEVM
jgi:hypothetical protein